MRHESKLIGIAWHNFSYGVWRLAWPVCWAGNVLSTLADDPECVEQCCEPGFYFDPFGPRVGSVAARVCIRNRVGQVGHFLRKCQNNYSSSEGYSGSRIY